MKEKAAIVRKIKQLVGENQTREALELLNKAQLSREDKDLILLNSRYNGIKNDQVMGLISDEEARQALVKINHGLLMLADRIQAGDSDLIGMNAGSSTFRDSGIGDSSKGNWLDLVKNWLGLKKIYMGWIIGLTILLITAVVFIILLATGVIKGISL